jgi:hypothetical protein
MAGIFISYRREDAAAQAGRLYDRLTAHFGQDRVFMDIDRSLEVDSLMICSHSASRPDENCWWRAGNIRPTDRFGRFPVWARFAPPC